MPFVKTNKYNLPTLDIAYEDIPKILNKNEEEIIDIAGYYEKQQEYIQKTLDNTVKRIISEELNDLIKIDENNFKQITHFKPKFYE
jgi:hypothetical protein